MFSNIEEFIMYLIHFSTLTYLSFRELDDRFLKICHKKCMFSVKSVTFA